MAGHYGSISVDMAVPARRGLKHSVAPDPAPHSGNGRAAGKPVKGKDPLAGAASLAHELRSCVTEADIVQVLYRGLSTQFGYDVVLMHVLEREGWYHRVAVDTGVLQDVIRRPLAESYFAKLYASPKRRTTTVVPFSRETWR